MSTTTGFDVRAHFTAMKSLGEAVLALKRARDLTLMAHGSTLAASTVHLLYEASLGLLNEMGAQLRALETSSDPETRATVHEILNWLAAPAAPVTQVASE